MPSWVRRALRRSPNAKIDRPPSERGLQVPSIPQETVFVPPLVLSFTEFTWGTITPCFSFTRQLPFDIVTEILGHASQVIFDDGAPRFIVSPNLLSLVCKSWRSHLNTTPLFWSSIILSLSQAKRWRNDYIAGLYLWLLRAGDLPLDIYIDGTANFTRSDLTSGHQICQFLVNCRSRWRRIDISSVDDEFAHLFDAYKSSGAYPLLQSYIIRRQPRVPLPFLSDFKCVPVLETLQITCSDTVTGSWQFDPVLSVVIKNISFTITQDIAACTILSSYPLLQTAQLHYPFNHSTYHLYDRKVVRHDHIRSLKITTETSSYISDSLLRLQAPKLQELHLLLEGLNEEWFDVVSSLEDFVSRSGCHLVRLSLQVTLLQENLFIHMLSFLPNLEVLDVHHVQISQCGRGFGGLTRAFFRKLHPNANNSFLPNLRIMKYDGPLGIETVDPLEALVLRLLPRPQSLGSKSNPSRVASRSHHSTSKLNFAKIVAEQNGRLISREFARAELVAQLSLLVERNALWLLNANGSGWEYDRVHSTSSSIIM